MTYCLIIDIPKMKRWHGAPPLLDGQDEADFDAFITSLATCVRAGDALTETLVYRYGVERWRIGQLLFQREKINLVLHSRLVEFDRRDEERRKFRDDKKINGAERADIVREDGTRGGVIDFTGDEDVSSIRRNLHYREDFKFDEMSAGRDFELSLTQYEMVERAIVQCDALASDLLRQMAIHRITLDEREEQRARERVSAMIDDLMEEQERERQERASSHGRTLPDVHP